METELSSLIHWCGVWYFIILFTEKADKDRVWCNSPKSFDKKLIILKHFGGDLQPSDNQMSHALSWIQTYDLPFSSIYCMLAKVGWLIGQSIGDAVSTDFYEYDTCCGEYMHIQVNFHVLEPLIRGKLVNVGGPELIWVNFKYKKLPNICYSCGHLGTQWERL